MTDLPPFAEARISCRRPAPVQSGPARLDQWIVEFEPHDPPEVEPLMGWIASDDVLQQVRMGFPSLEAAMAYCESQGVPYTVNLPHKRRAKRSYASNFESFEGGPNPVYPH